jgi:hypothetical protein
MLRRREARRPCSKGAPACLPNAAIVPRVAEWVEARPVPLHRAILLAAETLCQVPKNESRRG